MIKKVANRFQRYNLQKVVRTSLYRAAERVAFLLLFIAQVHQTYSL